MKDDEGFGAASDEERYSAAPEMTFGWTHKGTGERKGSVDETTSPVPNANLLGELREL